jgi:beta-1,4-mannosyltransferase
VAVVRLVVRGGCAVHVHWPEYLVRPLRGSRIDAAFNAVRLLRLAAALAMCGLLGVRIVWTVHNLGPHEPHSSWAALRAYDVLAATADVFVVHSRAAARRVGSHYRRAGDRTLVIPHGHYLGAHPPARATRAEVRARYGIPQDAFLMLAFGQVRRYKRLADLGGLVHAAGLPDVHLLVVGAAFEADLVGELERLRDERVHVDLRRVPANEVAELYGASDAAVMNHAELFSSGSLMLALSQGVPVITAGSDAAREVAGPPAVVTFDGPGTLRRAVCDLKAIDPETRRSAALAAARAAAWERAAATLRSAYACPPGTPD